MKRIETSENIFIDLKLDFQKQVTTSTGLQLILCKEASDYANRKTLKSVKVFLVFENEKMSSWLITKDMIPIFEHTSYEAVLCHLDMMVLD